MEEKDLELKIKELVHQCDAYLVILPKENSEALAIVDQFKTELSSMLKSLEVQHEQSTRAVLSPRELQVLNLVAQGHPNKEIAYQLSISPKTVQFHLKSLFTKLEVGSRTEAVTSAIKLRLITVS